MKMFICIFLTLLISLPTRAESTDSCKKTTLGTDFWIAFMESRNYNRDHELRLIVTSSQNTFFTITTGPNNAVHGTFTVTADSAIEVVLPWQTIEASGSENIQNRGVHLVAQDPVSVYAVNWDQHSADITVVYPTNALGSKYFAMCYQPYIDPDNPGSGGGRNSEFIIVATEDDTQVKITPSKLTDGGIPKDSTFEKTLNRGQVFQVQSENIPGSAKNGQGDLTGSKVEADKPVAVFSGSLSTTVPAGSCCWDHLFEQMPPFHAWGRNYFTVPLKTRIADRIRILAAEDNTKVQISNENFITLNSGEFKEMETHEPQHIKSDKPILVAQFSMSHDIDSLLTGGNGDPFMVVINSTDQWTKNAIFQSFQSPPTANDSSYFGIKRHFVNIITPSTETDKIFLDGKSIQDSFNFIPENEFAFARIETTGGPHLVESFGETGVQAYPYGFGKWESYGYSAGFNVDLRLDLGENIEFFEKDTLLLCFGDTLLLDARNHFDFYDWNTGEKTSSISVTNEGLFWVKAGTIEGCVLSDSVFVKISAPATQLAAESEIECAPFARRLDAGEGFSNYRWENDAGILLSDDRYFIASETDNYKVTVTDKYRCSASDRYSLFVFPTPDVEIKGDPVVCNKLQTLLQVEVSHEADSLWNFNDNFSWSSNSESLKLTEQQRFSVQVEAPAQGDFEVYYTLKTIDSCVVTDTFKIRFHSMPVAKFELTDIAQCARYSREIKFTGEATTSAEFLWNLGGRQFIDTLGYQHFIVSVGAQTSQPGMITLVVDDKGCISTPFSELIGADPNFSMNADKTKGCDRMTVNFTGNMLVPQTVDYTWTINNHVKKHVNAVKYFFDEPGFYDINLTVKNTFSGCTNSFTIDSMVRIYPTPKAIIDIDPEKCYSQQAMLTYPYPTDSTWYQWEFAESELTGFGYDSVLMLINNPTEPVQLTVTEYGCTGKTDEKIVKRKPVFDFLTGTTQGCQPLAVQAESVTTDPMVSFYWITDSIPYPGETANYNFPDTGKFDIALIARSAETGCADTLLKPELITVKLKPRAKFEPDYTLALTDNSTISFTNYAMNADSYFWYFGDGQTSSEINPIHQYNPVGLFEAVQVASANWGCADTFKTVITIIPATNYVPNAFRPGSDLSQNQVFMPSGLGVTNDGFNLKIFNRWGELIFESDSPLKPWDGKIRNGTEAPMGNYVWITNYIDIQGINRSEKGQVLLIR